MTDTKPFNPYSYLDDDSVKECLIEAFHDDDPDVFIVSLRDAVKAIGVARIADMTGLGRNSLYKTIKSGAQPRWSTIQKVLKALNIDLKAA